MTSTYRNCIILNDFLSRLSFEFKDSLSLQDLNSLTQNLSNSFGPRIQQLQDFIDNVKTECVLSQRYFSFADIPDLIIRHKISRKDYSETIHALLAKTKTLFLKQKQKKAEKGV